MFGKSEVKANRPRDGRHCDLCGCSCPAVRCDKCGSQIFCLSCDDMYHRHPKRKFHLRKAVDPTPNQQARPVLPMKVSSLTNVPGDPSKMPLPPPRKKKPGKSIFDSFRRASPSSEPSNPYQTKKEYSWSDRLGNITKFMSNRPLPPVPDATESEEKVQSVPSASPNHDLSFIHKRVDEKPPALPQRQPRNQQFEEQLNGETNNQNVSTNAFNGNESNADVTNLPPMHPSQNWGMHPPFFNQNEVLGFGTIRRQSQPQERRIDSPNSSAMTQSSSASDLTALPDMSAVPHMQQYPPYAYNSNLPPHYPYPMYPQYPPYPQYFGNSWANLATPPQATDADFSDQSSEVSHRRFNRGKYKNQMDKKAKRSQSVLVDRMAYPGHFYPFGPYPPGYPAGPPWMTGHSMETPSSPGSMRSLSRLSQSHRRKVTDDEDDYSSSPISRPKSSSSEVSKNRRLQKVKSCPSSSSSDDEEQKKKNVNSKASPSVERRGMKQNLRRRTSSPRRPSLTNENRVGDHDAERISEKSPGIAGPHEKNDVMPNYAAVGARKKSDPSVQVMPNEKIKVSGGSSSIPDVSWQCKHCTYINPANERICLVCCKTATTDESPTSPDQKMSELTVSEKTSETGQLRQEAGSHNSDRDRQDIANLSTALDEAEKQINQSLEELLRVKGESTSVATSTSQQDLNSIQTSEGVSNKSNLETVNNSTTESHSPVKPNAFPPYKSAFHNVGTSTKYNSIGVGSEKQAQYSKSPKEGIVSPEISKDSYCQTYEDVSSDFFQNQLKNVPFQGGRGGQRLYERGEVVSPAVPYSSFRGPVPQDRAYNGMHRGHSMASLYVSNTNNAGPTEYGGMNLAVGPSSMVRSLSRASLLGENEGWADYPVRLKPDFYLSIEELVERRRQETMRAQGLELVRMIREAEQQGFTADDIQVALNNCGKQNPVNWLQDNWKSVIRTVVTLSTNYGKDKRENDVGVLSENEARDALRLHKGNIWAAVTECVEGRQRKFLELSARGNFTFKEIVDALTTSGGNVEMAYSKLTNTTLQPFLMRIYGSGEGLPNLEGASAHTFTPIQDEYLQLYKNNEEMRNNKESDDELWDNDSYENDEDWENDDNNDRELSVERSSPEQPDDHERSEKFHTLTRDNTCDNMLSIGSDKSDYCDAFGPGLSERYLSSTSIDEIYLIDEEVDDACAEFNFEKSAEKQRKPSFLNKLAALRKGGNVSKKVENEMRSNENLAEFIQEQNDVRSSSSDNLNSFNPLTILKQTFTTLKDSVTGTNQKADKNSSSIYDKRTIVVNTPEALVRTLTPTEKTRPLPNDGLQDSLPSTSIDKVDERNSENKSINDVVYDTVPRKNERLSTGSSIKDVPFNRPSKASAITGDYNFNEIKAEKTAKVDMKLNKVTEIETQVAVKSTDNRENSIPDVEIAKKDKIIDKLVNTEIDKTKVNRILRSEVKSNSSNNEVKNSDRMSLVKGISHSSEEQRLLGPDQIITENRQIKEDEDLINQFENNSKQISKAIQCVTLVPAALSDDFHADGQKSVTKSNRKDIETKRTVAESDRIVSKPNETASTKEQIVIESNETPEESGQETSKSNQTVMKFNRKISDTNKRESNETTIDSNHKTLESSKIAIYPNQTAKEFPKTTEDSTIAAKESNQTAKESTIIANESNQTAKKSNITAKESNQTAKESTITANESNIAAKESNITAKESNIAAKELNKAVIEKKPNLVFTTAMDSNQIFAQLNEILSGSVSSTSFQNIDTEKTSLIQLVHEGEKEEKNSNKDRYTNEIACRDSPSTIFPKEIQSGNSSSTVNIPNDQNNTNVEPIGNDIINDRNTHHIDSGQINKQSEKISNRNTEATSTLTDENVLELPKDENFSETIENDDKISMSIEHKNIQEFIKEEILEPTQNNILDAVDDKNVLQTDGGASNLQIVVTSDVVTSTSPITANELEAATTIVAEDFNNAVIPKSDEILLTNSTISTTTVNKDNIVELAETFDAPQNQEASTVAGNKEQPVSEIVKGLIKERQKEAVLLKKSLSISIEPQPLNKNEIFSPDSFRTNEERNEEHSKTARADNLNLEIETLENTDKSLQQALQVASESEVAIMSEEAANMIIMQNVPEGSGSSITDINAYEGDNGNVEQETLGTEQVETETDSSLNISETSAIDAVKSEASNDSQNISKSERTETNSSSEVKAIQVEDKEKTLTKEKPPDTSKLVRKSSISRSIQERMFQFNKVEPAVPQTYKTFRRKTSDAKLDTGNVTTPQNKTNEASNQVVTEGSSKTVDADSSDMPDSKVTETANNHGTDSNPVSIDDSMDLTGEQPSTLQSKEALNQLSEASTSNASVYSSSESTRQTIQSSEDTHTVDIEINITTEPSSFVRSSEDSVNETKESSSESATEKENVDQIETTPQMFQLSQQSEDMVVVSSTEQESTRNDQDQSSQTGDREITNGNLEPENSVLDEGTLSFIDDHVQDLNTDHTELEDDEGSSGSDEELDLSSTSSVRPIGHLRRMSFNTRKEAIYQERHKVSLSPTTEEKPWFLPKKTEVYKPALPKRSIKQQLEFERKVRLLVSERKCRTYRKAEIVAQLMELKFEETEAIYAANECSNLDQAISFLQQECQLCTGMYPIGEMISMVHCSHKACRECISAYFTIQIRDRTIMELLCPFCNEPDITDEDVAQDYFNHLDIMLKKIMNDDIHELFQRKLRDRVLMKDPNFRWCSQCSSGFITDPYLKRLVCPDCRAVTCASCRRRWEREHEGVTCEVFASWKDEQDPETQTTGLAKLLTEDGIDCPSCHFRYALAKGGCMHFKCTQCQHDFCSGCSKPFRMGKKCGVSEFCAKLGLHAHHPRNCLFYLRDKEPGDLQKLLNMNNIPFDKDRHATGDTQRVCDVLEQKETSQGMVDDICGKDVENGYAGLCRLHYVEYLGQLVNKHKVDPIQIFDNDDLELVLKRASIRLPPKRYRETYDEYREKLVELIEELLPLGENDGS